MMSEAYHSSTPENTAKLPAQQQAAIARLGLLALTAEGQSELLQQTVRVVAEVLSADLSLIFEADSSSHIVTLLAGHGLKDEPAPGETVRVNDSLFKVAFSSPNPLVIDRLRGAQRPENPWLSREQDIVSGVIIAIRENAIPSGVLGVFKRAPGTYTEDEIEFLQSVARLLGAAIHRRQLEEKLVALNDQLEKQVITRSRLINLLQDIAMATDEAISIPEAMRKALDMICAFTGWPIGHVFYCKGWENKDLVSTSIWSTQQPERWQDLINATTRVRQWTKTGLPGSVLASGKAVVISNLNNLNFSRTEAAEKSGIKAGFAFPLLVGKDIVAVMEFFCDQPIEPDAKFVDVLTHIGSQLGRVVERRQNEEAIRANQERLADAQVIAKLGTWEWNTLTNQMSWSDNLYRILDLSPRDHRESYEGFIERIHPDDRLSVDQAIQMAYMDHNEFKISHRILKPNGETRALHTYGKVVKDSQNRPSKIIGICQDVTEIKQVTEKMRTGEELVQRVVTAAPIILWAIDKGSKIILAEGKGLSLLGITSKDLVGEVIKNIILDRKDVQEHIKTALSGQEVVAEITTDSTILETRYTPTHDEHGNISGVIGISVDVSERVRMESALRASEARFRTIFERSAVGISIIDLSRRFLVSNPAMQEMLGYNKQELIGTEIASVIPATDHPAILPRYQAALEGKENFSYLEQKFLKKDGRSIWGNATMTMIRNDDGSPRFAILLVEDITSRKVMEAELAEVNKRLVASRERERLYLAQELHDEPLQELYGLLYQLEDLTNYVQGEESTSSLEEAQSAVNRIINTLRGICRELRPPALAHFGLEGAIRELAERFGNEHPEIKLHLDLMYDGQLLTEQVRLTLFRILQQALSNVARHARASNVYIRFKYSQDQAGLEVDDDGIGFSMPAGWVSFVREGHLGLAGAAERAEIVNGHFRVTSSPGKGTMIRVTVPREANVKEQIPALAQ